MNLFGVLVLLCLLGHVYTSLDAAVVVERCDDIIKPKSEPYLYRVASYSNGLKALLSTLKDPQMVERSIFGLVVRAGSIHEGRLVHGLAHLLEHTLLMQTEKYRDEHGFPDFIRRNGGMFKAETYSEFTFYYFVIGSKMFDQALEIFSELVANPSFEPSSIGREINAIHAEFELKKNTNTFRTHTIQEALFNSRHPQSNFDHGTAESLSVDGIRESLLDFHRHHYSPDQMCLYVYSNDGLDAQEGKISKAFGRMAARPTKSLLEIDELNGLSNGDKLALLQSPLGRSAKGKLLRIKKIDSGSQMTITFQLPPVTKLSDYSSLYLLSYLMAFPRWICELKTSGLVGSVTVIFRSVTDYYTLYDISISLTPKGLRNYKEVVSAMLSMAARVQAEDIPEHVWMDYKTSNDLNFDYAPKGTPDDIYGMVMNLHLMEPKYVLGRRYVSYESDARGCKSLARLLSLNNMLLTISSDQFGDLQFAHVEKWCGSEYEYGDLDLGEMDIDPSKFDFPPNNALLPRDFTIYGKESENPQMQPRMIHGLCGLKLWYKLDDIFEQPITSFIFVAKFPFLGIDLDSGIRMQVLSSMLELQLHDLIGEAALAYLELDIRERPNGIEFEFRGLSDKLSLFAVLTANRVRELLLVEAVFDVAKEREMRRIGEREIEQSIFLAKNIAIVALNQYLGSSDKELEVLENLKFEDIQKLFLQMKDAAMVDIKILAVGNIQATDAIGTSRRFVESLFNKPPKYISISDASSCAMLPIGKPLVIVQRVKCLANKNHAVFYFIKTGAIADYQAIAFNAIFNTAFKSCTFNTLRNRDALGYVAKMGLEIVGTYKGVSISAVSPSANPIQIEHRIQALLADTIKLILDEMSEDAFAAVRENARSSNFPKFMDVRGEADFYWNLISGDGDPRFDSVWNLAQAIGAMTLPEFAEMAERLVLAPDKRCTLSVHVWSGTSSADEMESARAYYDGSSIRVYRSVDEFKADSKLN